ncbi:hypothetical protein AVEN_23123-1 [Araneus ventricosus]|uniref:Uncharacterized protein n=1 Tax=Araneus ventricosus TaxID=182803 RepID=A0A4Y2NUN0_ARAVE|nr:hypothetical protein AVEN_23123-1 [Araneus ventricosus]
MDDVQGRNARFDSNLIPLHVSLFFNTAATLQRLHPTAWLLSLMNKSRFVIGTSHHNFTPTPRGRKGRKTVTFRDTVKWEVTVEQRSGIQSFLNLTIVFMIPWRREGR